LGDGERSELVSGWLGTTATASNATPTTWPAADGNVQRFTGVGILAADPQQIQALTPSPG